MTYETPTTIPHHLCSAGSTRHGGSADEGAAPDYSPAHSRPDGRGMLGLADF